MTAEVPQRRMIDALGRTLEVLSSEEQHAGTWDSYTFADALLHVGQVFEREAPSAVYVRFAENASFRIRERDVWQKDMTRLSFVAMHRDLASGEQDEQIPVYEAYREAMRNWNEMHPEQQIEIHPFINGREEDVAAVERSGFYIQVYPSKISNAEDLAQTVHKNPLGYDFDPKDRNRHRLLTWLADPEADNIWLYEQMHMLVTKKRSPHGEQIKPYMKLLRALPWGEKECAKAGEALAYKTAGILDFWTTTPKELFLFPEAREEIFSNLVQLLARLQRPDIAVPVLEKLNAQQLDGEYGGYPHQVTIRAALSRYRLQQNL